MGATEFAMFGDTNMQPNMEGLYSCNWLANTTPCVYQVPDHGPHGRIDAGFHSQGMEVEDLARIAGKNPDLDRLPGGGSDHGLLVGKMRRKAYIVSGSRREGPGEWFKFIVWNVERDRNEREIKQMTDFLRQVIVKYGIQILFLQEVQQYHIELKQLAGDLGFKVFHGPGHAKGQNAVLVKRSIRTSHPATMQMSKEGWQTAAGPMHAPIYQQAVTIDKFLRIASFHWVVGVDVVNNKLVGPTARTRVWRQTMVKTRRWCRKYVRRS